MRPIRSDSGTVTAAPTLVGMVDLILWLGDRLEFGIPLVLVLVAAGLLVRHLWRKRQRQAEQKSSSTVEQADEGQVVVMQGNRAGGGVRVSQRRR